MNDISPNLSKYDFGTAIFMCEAPAFHQGPRPFVADRHALASDNPRRIRFFALV
jgi:hypothetical protein